MSSESPNPNPSTEVEVQKNTLERGLQFLQSIEAEYREGTRTQRELLFFANKLQELFFNAIQSKKGGGPVREYDAHAQLGIVTDEDTTELFWTELKNTPEESLAAPEVTLSEYLATLKTQLRDTLATYRSQFTTVSLVVAEAQSVLQNEQAMPSEIILATHGVIAQLYK